MRVGSAYSEDTYGKHALTEAGYRPSILSASRRINVPKNHDTAAVLEAIRNAIGEGKVRTLCPDIHQSEFRLVSRRKSLT